ncbi:MAG: DUF6320 domain-containing protein [Spirochaetales bacterium]|nr:DUF6320 domain-containing protein [Spirochaetales bacterium]
MPYCPRCGVEVEDRLENCPLCDTAIPDEVRRLEREEAPYPVDLVHPRKMYKSLTVKQRRRLIFSLMILTGLLPIILTTVLDVLQNRRVTWSYFVDISLVGAFCMAYLHIRFVHKPMVALHGTVLLFLLFYMLLRRLPPGEFLRTLDFQIILAVAVTGECVVTFLLGAQRKWFNIVGYCLFMSALFLVGLNYILSRNMGWAAPTASVLLPLAVYFVYMGRVKRRGMNVVGFFFLLLGLMLLALDFFSGYAGWSLVTSIVFGFLALVFYLLHFVLFNDTDWRKALHL